MKFNHIFLSVALSAALMGGFTSCDDFLAEDPYAFGSTGCRSRSPGQGVCHDGFRFHDRRRRNDSKDRCQL